MNLPGRREQDGLVRLVYSSEATVRMTSDMLMSILTVARAHNGIDGITVLLVSDGHGFLQIIEGPAEAVNETFQRIARDERHRNVIVHEHRPQRERCFGEWMMGSTEERESTASVEGRLAGILRNAPDYVRERFLKHVRREAARAFIRP
jgi:hypothetical protein